MITQFRLVVVSVVCMFVVAPITVSAHGTDLDEAPCQHDAYQQADRGGFVGRGADLTIPQRYAIPSAEEDTRRRSMHRRNTAASATVVGGYPLRIVVSAADVMNVSNTCQNIGQSVPDFIGGRITCVDAQDILTSEKRTTLLDYVFPLAISRLTSVVRLVRSVASPLSVFHGICPYFTVPSDQLTAGVPNADLALYVGASKTYGQTIAWSSLCGMDQYNRPIFGRMNVASRYIPANWTSTSGFEQERIIRTLTHEIVHLLGFTYDYFSTFLASRLLSSVQGLRGKPYNVVVWVGEHAVQAARTQFNCPTLSFVELEDQGGTGTALSHLERHTYLQELMNGISGARWRGNQFSAITLGILMDMGHYVTSATDGEFMAWGHRAGCSVVNDRCILQEEDERSASSQGSSSPDAGRELFRPPAAQDAMFCSPNVTTAVEAAAALAAAFCIGNTSLVTALQWEEAFWIAATSTSVGDESTYDHLAFGDCKLFRAAAALPGGMQYFPTDPRVGGNMSLVDYCPVVLPPTVAVSSGIQETQQCYDGARSAPGVWRVDNETASSTRYTRGPGHLLYDADYLSFTGPHAASINVVVVTGSNCSRNVSNANSSSSGSSNEGRNTDEAPPTMCRDWSWTQDAMCVEMRCVVNSTAALQSSSALSNWVQANNRSAPLSDDQWSAISLQWRLHWGEDDSTSEWCGCDDQHMDGGTGALSDTIGVFVRSRSTSNTTDFAFGRCPRREVLCGGGDLWVDAIWLPATTTTAPTTKSVPTTTIKPLPTTTTATTLSPPRPPPPPTTTVISVPPTSTAPPPTSTSLSTPTATTQAPQGLMYSFQFKWSGENWHDVLLNTVARANVTSTLRAQTARFWNVSLAAVNITGLRVGSLIADIQLMWPSTSGSGEEPSSPTSLTNVAALAAIYVDVTGGVLSDVSLVSATPTMTTASPTGPSSSEGAVQYCPSRGWCVGVVAAGASVVGLLCAGVILRRLQVCTDDSTPTSPRDVGTMKTSCDGYEAPPTSPPASPRRPKLASFQLKPQEETSRKASVSDASRMGRQASMLSSTNGPSLDGAGSPRIPLPPSNPASPRGVQSDSELSTVDVRNSQPRPTVGSVGGLVTTAWDALGTPSPSPAVTPTTAVRRIDSFDGSAFSPGSTPRALDRPYNVLAPQPGSAPRLTSVPMVGRRKRYWND
jgi:hypothetical protein